MKYGQYVKYICVGIVATLLSIPVLADADTPTTLDDVRGILGDAARTAQELKQVNEQLEDLTVRAKAWRRKLDAHNANGCTYPEGHPEACAAYERERKDLDTQKSALVTEAESYDSQRASLRSHFGILRARLRIVRLLGGLQDWVDHDVIPCTKIESEITAASCLNSAWERHP